MSSFWLQTGFREPPFTHCPMPLAPLPVPGCLPGLSPAPAWTPRACGFPTPACRSDPDTPSLSAPARLPRHFPGPLQPGPEGPHSRPPGLLVAGPIRGVTGRSHEEAGSGVGHGGGALPLQRCSGPSAAALPETSLPVVQPRSGRAGPRCAGRRQRLLLTPHPIGLSHCRVWWAACPQPHGL